MPDQRWGFEDDSEFDKRPAKDSRTTDEEEVTGTDADNVVVVSATPAGHATKVRIAEQWRDKVRPDGLGSSVTTAVNAMTMAALAYQLQAQPVRPPQSDANEDSSYLADPQVVAAQLSKLADDALAEAQRFLDQVGPVINDVTTVDSAGRHVAMSGRRGQVSQVTIDAGWAEFARPTEIESEVIDALRRLQARMVPDELAAGPQGPAITELNRLMSNPADLLRRLGL